MQSKDGTRSPVVVCGAGPVGLATAIELARHGVRTIVVERHPGTAIHPKARNINTRTMEIVRAWGTEAHAAMVALNLPDGWTSQIVYTSGLGGEEYGRMPTQGFSGTLPVGSISPERPILTSQDLFEPVFLATALRTGLVDVRFNLEVVAIDQCDGDVAVSVNDRTSGVSSVIGTEYVIAADGAASTIRDHVGIGLTGRAAIGHYVNVYFRADLDPWVAHRPAVMYWVANPDQRGVFQPLDGRGRWLCQISYDGTPAALARYDTDGCIGWIRDAIGDAALTPEVISIGTWTMNATVAERFRSNRVFLVGDAAQQMPPTGGFGVNTGIQSAHNLAWKLAHVLHGHADVSLLDTYDQERRPVAEYNTARSLDNARLVVDVAEAGQGRHPDGISPATAVARARRYGNFAGMELGYHYDNPTVTLDSTPPPTNTDPVMDYVPTARPGHRAPHFWIDDAEHQSVLDLFTTHFAVITTHQETWIAAARATAAELDITLDTPQLDRHSDAIRRTYGIEPGGAVLVRPDGHVAARWTAEPTNQAAELEDAVRRALCRP
ncbi:MAG: FAD-dependent monooxygenase [Actinobacteria bacterium]|nr:FAD-dependent monooxygenase [Actinomycetota bacterium]